MKSPDENFNFASVQENGEVWFYGIVSNAEAIGDRQMGIEYLKELAQLVNGSVYDQYTEWLWGVKRDGSYVSITEYLEKQNEWKGIINDVLERIQS